MQTKNSGSLGLESYRDRLELDEPFVAAAPAAISELSQIIETLNKRLLAERNLTIEALHGMEQAGIRPRSQLQALATVRQPRPHLPDETLAMFDSLLQSERQRHTETDATTLRTIADDFPATRYAAASRTSLWRGDITTLAVDAIVNAANSELLGCYSPFHACIDNAIHSAAGPRLRADCAEIIALQGHDEPLGTAKITRGYNLPSRFVLHTVGPTCPPDTSIPSAEAEDALRHCYGSCLDLAAEVPQIRSLAFCCISTGVFGFPAEPAADIALSTVAEWLTRNPDRFNRVIFNVFSDGAAAHYGARLV